MKTLKKDGISVIVTVFNKEAYIEETIKSVLQQFNSRKKYQLIIVNDGSTDCSLDLIKRVVKNNNVYTTLISQKNTGPSIAINNALKYVKYSFIKFLDGDDILAPDSLDYMKEQMEKKNIDLLYGDWKWSNDPKKYRFRKNKPSSKIMEDSVTKFLISGWGGSSNLMIRTEVILEIKGCDEDVFVQDFSIPMRVAGNHLKSKESKEFNVGTTEKIICVGPRKVANRIMSNEGQTLYDLSIATLNFIEESNLLNLIEKNRALKKIISRCWRWRIKVSKESILGRFLFVYLLSKINIGLCSKKIRLHVYRTWFSNNQIRKIDKSPDVGRKILVYVGLDLLGDALLKVPFLKSLRKRFPNSKITWLAGKGSSVFQSSLKPISEGLIDKIEDNRSFGSSFFDLIKKNDFGSYDIIIDTQKRLLTTLVLKKIKCKIFISPCANFFFSDFVPKNTKTVNLSVSLINLVEIFHCRSLNYSNNFQPQNSKKFCICPGASVIWKKWPLENFIEVSEFLIKKRVRPIFLLGPKEGYIERNLRRNFSQEIGILSTNDPIKTIEMAKTCIGGISNDTGCGHLIATTGIPVITLFGPTDAEKFAPIGNNNNFVLSSVELFKSKNIDSIPVPFVLNKINLLLKSYN